MVQAAQDRHGKHAAECSHLGFAPRVQSTLRRVETSKSVDLSASSDRIAIDHLNRARVYSRRYLICHRQDGRTALGIFRTQIDGREYQHC